MTLGNDEDLNGLKAIGRICANVLQHMSTAVRPGMTTAELDLIGRRMLEATGARSAPESCYNFPGATWTLSAHEGRPGHELQFTAMVERGVSQARTLYAFNSVNVEGWALYAEKLVAENGWYEGDPEGLLGMLDAQLFRARRLVVDTGLHAKHWTRQQAIDYGLEPSEVERYVVNPGQACAYMIGQLKLLELRDEARNTLGDKFQPKEFHNVVLKTGTAPLDMVAGEVDRYIRTASGKKQ